MTMIASAKTTSNQNGYPRRDRAETGGEDANQLPYEALANSEKTAS
jgi:hypothetical protein